MVGHQSGARLARISKNWSGRLRKLRNEAGFTLIEVLIAGLMLVIIGAPLSLILTSSAALAGSARERTTADQLAQTSIETMHSLAYSQIGINGGNPDGDLTAVTNTNLPSGEKVTVNTAVSYVNDPVPGAYVTKADYKKVVLTVNRVSDGTQLAQKTTYMASASAPPLRGTAWVQITRTVVDAKANTPIVGATVHLTGGKSGATEDRTDKTDAAGSVTFPALGSDTAIPPANYTLATTAAPYLMYPDDMAPDLSAQIPATPGLASSDTIRMYKPGITLTVNVQNSNGTTYTAGNATVSIDSSRCGVQTQSVPTSGSVVFTDCLYAPGKLVNLIPNVLGQTPAFGAYYVTVWAGSTPNTIWGATPSAGVLVPSNYPTVLTQSVNVLFNNATPYATKPVTVTVKKGASNDTNARVELTGGAASIYLFGTVNGSGQVTFNVPVTASTLTYTVNAMDGPGGNLKGSTTFTANNLSSPTSYAPTVTVS